MLIYLSVINLIEFDYIASKNNNKINHILNGNIGNNKSLSILHWNKGSTHFHNKFNDLSYIIDRYKPDIMTLCEANFHIDRDNSDLKFLDKYNVLTTDQKQNLKISRQVILIDKRLKFTTRHDLEN